MSARIDATGKRFGLLTAIAPAPSRNGRARWKLRCDCGQIYETSYQSLRSGSAKSCGCLRRNPQYRPPSKIPEKGKCHPFVRAIWVRIADEQAYQKEVAKRSGIHEATIRQWRERRAPGLAEIEAVINALGGRLVLRWDAE